MASGNFVSLYGAIKVNGVLLTYNQFKEDINPAGIRFVMPCTIKDINDNLVNAYWIKYQNDRQLTADDIYLPVNTYIENLTEFKAALTALNTSNTFTIYTDLISSSQIAAGLVPENYDMIIGDLNTSRYFIPKQVVTKVNVNITNEVLPVTFSFAGDQVYAGDYQYFGQ